MAYTIKVPAECEILISGQPNSTIHFRFMMDVRTWRLEVLFYLI